MIGNNVDLTELCAVIEKNNRAERDAMFGYYKMLHILEEPIYRQIPEINDYISQVREIISDEMNHSERLSAMVIALSGIKPAID